MRIYLENCAFNRPFDDQSQIRIRLESEEKLYVQEKIKKREIELGWSCILDIENDQNPFEEKRTTIEKWKKYAIVDIRETASLVERENNIVIFGVKAKDALHVSSAIEGDSNYFLTTDNKLIKRLSVLKEILVLHPLDMLGVIHERNN